MRFPSIAAVAAVAALAAPAAAQAATYTVAAGNGACDGADTACESLVLAAARAGGGDTVQVAAGTYAEAPTFASPGVTITGAPGVVVTGSMAFSGDGPTPTVLEKVVVAPSTPASPAVGVTGTAGVSVRDSLLISTGGIGMTIANGAGNTITRSTVVSGGADSAAVLVQPGAAATTVVLDSSILSGGSGAGGSGLTVKTGVSQAPGTAGGATITARHITVAGTALGIVIDSSAAGGVLTAVGSIAATVSDSIVLGTSPAPKIYPGLLLIPPNTATLGFSRTDQATPADTLFANPAKRNFRLRADSPAIDKASITPGDSATDIDGQPRSSGAASDQGADEFVNTAPTAVLAVKSGTPRSGEPVLFDASGSTDREAGIGGPIVKYVWSFGDGSAAETTAAQTSHVYAAAGTVAVTVQVTDKQGAASEPVSLPLTVVDGGAPAVTITKPKNNQKIKRSKTTTKTVTRKGRTTKVRSTALTPITISGTATDDSGVKNVVITVEKLGAKASTAADAQCTWLDAGKGLLKKACSKPVLIRPSVRAGKWSYNPLKKLKKGLSTGTYRVSAYGTDNAGAFGNTATKNKVIRFTLTAK